MSLTKVSYSMLRGSPTNVIDFGAIGDGVADDTAAIQAALNSFTVIGGDLLFPIGIYKITATLIVNKPINIYGAGEGSEYQPTQLPATKILWGSAVALPMINFGGFGTLISGGGINNLMIDGNAVATNGLVIKDSQRGNFTNLTITKVVTNGLLLQNTPALDPTGFHIFDDLRIQLRGGAAQTANGVYVDGSNSGGAGGVTLCTFRRCRIDHANGHGVYVGDFGDFFLWESLQTFRADVETGEGVWFGSTLATAICGYHTFDTCNVSAGWRFETAGINTGTRITNAGQVDINTGRQILFGAGAADVRCDTGLGFSYGQGLLPDLNYFHSSDRMNFIRFDSANNVLQTSDGNWRTALVGAGTIAQGGQPGGATRLTTGAVANNVTSILDIGSIGTDGISTNTQFALSFSLAPITTATTQIILGVADQNVSFPNNGIYIQYDYAASPNWIIKTTRAGVTTAVATTLSVGIGLVQFYIFKNSSGASFYFRTSTNRLFSFIGTITTNIPIVALNTIARIETFAASASSVDLYGIKIGVDTEVLGP